MFVEMYERAEDALKDKTRIPNSATHFHEDHLERLDPLKFQFMCEIDGLVFYKEIIHARN